MAKLVRNLRRRKLLAVVVLAAVLLCGCFATGAETQSLGGWQVNTEFTPVLREEEELLFEKARKV